MRVIEARNVHQALPKGIELLKREGIRVSSRNGDVLKMRGPVTTVYERPRERLVFWKERDVNTAFLVAEALWMLAGRNDLRLMTQYIKDFGRYSDDGSTLGGAYGHRWRRHFNFDQLHTAAARLMNIPDDRRTVVAMWDAETDLIYPAQSAKDLPCNDVLTLQRDENGRLDMTVFCRSNDIIWGAYFANAFHFSILQEYMASWIGCDVGVYEQVSVNYHAYVDVLAAHEKIAERALDRVHSVPERIDDPYERGDVTVAPMANGTGDGAIFDFDNIARSILAAAEEGTGWFPLVHGLPRDKSWPFVENASRVLLAHHAYKRGDRELAASTLELGDSKNDLIVSMKAWLDRRASKAATS